MEGEKKARKALAIVKEGGKLPAVIEELLPMFYVGTAAVAHFREKLRIMNLLELRDQSDATLKDGQDVGEMLIDVNVRIGELAAKEKRSPPDHGGKRGSSPSGKPAKHERLGLGRDAVKRFQRIAKRPDIVAKVKADAREAGFIISQNRVIVEIRKACKDERGGEVLRHDLFWLGMAKHISKMSDRIKADARFPAKIPAETLAKVLKAHEILTYYIDLLEEKENGKK